MPTETFAPQLAQACFCLPAGAAEPAGAPGLASTAGAGLAGAGWGANVSGWQRSQLANVFPLAEPARAPGLFSTAGAQLDGLSWLGSICYRLANVLVGKCHWLANVPVGKCLGWQMTAGKCHGGQMTAGKSPGGKGSAGKCISTQKTCSDLIFQPHKLRTLCTT